MGNQSSFSVGILGLSTLLALSSCGGDGGRSLERDKDLGIENTDPTSLDNALVIEFITEIDDQGAETYSMTANLHDRSKTGEAVWSDPKKLGGRFLILLGGQRFQMSLPSAEATTYQLQAPARALQAADLMSYHGAELSIADLNEKTLGRSSATPRALGDYPLSPALPPLTNRFLTNCEDQTSQPSILRWRNQSNIPFAIEFWGSDSKLKRSFTTSDSSSWTLSPEVFPLYFTPEQISEFDTQGSLGEYGSGIAVGRVARIRSSVLYKVTLETAQRSELRILVRAKEVANYRIRYEGGCGL